MMSRADNLIIFGMPEVESLPAIKRSVDELLTFIVCKSVPLHDVSTWVVMSAVRKLKEFKMSGLY